MFRKREDVIFGLDQSDLQRLATYNGEVARGIMHTAEYKHRMAGLQNTYNTNMCVETLARMP